MMVIWVDDRNSPREVGQDFNVSLADSELPRLGIVAIRRECCVADEIPHFRGLRQQCARHRDGGIVFFNRTHLPQSYIYCADTSDCQRATACEDLSSIWHFERSFSLNYDYE